MSVAASESARRLVQRSGRTAAGRAVGRAGYEAVARGLAAALAHAAPGVSIAAAGSLADGEIVPGVSDVDLVAVVPDDDAAAAVRARWVRLPKPLAAGLAVYRSAELRDSATVLDAPAPATLEDSLLRRGRPRDAVYRRLHPGLNGAGATWRVLAGPPVTPGPPPDPRLAAWLELQWWWRFAFLAAARPDLHYAPYVAVKLVAEPARIWLWLEHRERVSGRIDALLRALARAPEEGPGIEAALALHAQLAGRPPVPLPLLLATGLRFAERIATRLADDARAAGHTTTRLDGDHATPLPLVDWRARAMPPAAEESLLALPGDPADPEALVAALALERPGLAPALCRGPLLVLPGDALSDRVLLRAIACPPTDPVCAALLAGDEHAAFPELPGLSLEDCSRRAAEEHAAWLRSGGEDPRLLLSSARAALWRASVLAGDPVLPLTRAAVERAIGGPPDRDRVVALVAEAVAA